MMRLVALIITFSMLSSVLCDNYTVGFLVSWTGWDVGTIISGAGPLAVEDINNDPTVLSDVVLSWQHSKTECSDAGGAVNAVLQQVPAGVDVIIGPSCSSSCVPTQLFLNFYNVPQISYSCTAISLSEKSLYPLFARTVSPRRDIGKFYYALFQKFNWNRVAILTSTEDSYSGTAGTALAYLQNIGVDVLFQTFDVGPSRESTTFERGTRRPLLQQIKDKDYRIIWVFSGNGGDFRDIMLTAKEMGMTVPGYSYLAAFFSESYYIGTNGWMGNDGRDTEAQEAFEGLIGEDFSIPSGLIDTFTSWKQRAAVSQQRHFNLTLSDEAVQNYPVQGAKLYDAVWLWARAADAVLADGGDPTDGKLIAAKLDTLAFQGIAGSVNLDENLDNQDDVAFFNFRGGSRTKIAEWTSLTEKLSEISPGYDTLVFTGNTNDVPSDSSPIETWVEPDAVRYALLGIGTFLVAASLAVAAAVFIFRDKPVFVISSRNFMVSIALGCSLLYAYALVAFASPSVAVCTIQAWVLHIGFAIVFTGLFLKIWRINEIFNMKSIKKKVISDLRLFCMQGLMLAVVIVYLIVYSAAGRPNSRQKFTNNGEEYHVCGVVSSVYDIIILVAEGLLLLYGLYLCYAIRRVKSFWNESKYIVFSVYTVAICGVMTLIILSIVKDRFRYTIIATGVLFATTIIMVAIYVPKFMNMDKPKSYFRNKLMTISLNAPSTLTAVTDAHSKKASDELHNNNKAYGVTSSMDIRAGSDAISGSAAISSSVEGKETTKKNKKRSRSKKGASKNVANIGTTDVNVDINVSPKNEDQPRKKRKKRGPRQ